MKRQEDNLQRSIVDYVRLVAPECFLHSIPNDAQRSQSDTWRMYWTGFVKGMFDLCVLAPGGQAHYIEVKCKGNKLSDAQEGVKERFIQMSVPYVVAYSVDDVKAALQQWKLIRVGRSAA